MTRTAGSRFFGPAPEGRGAWRRRPRFGLIALVSGVAVLGTAILLRHAATEVDALAKQQFLEQEMLACRQTALGIEGTIARLVREMENLAENPAVQRIDPVEARREMERVFAYVRGLSVNDISRTDADGIVRLPLTSPELVGQDFSGRDYFRRVREQPRGVPVFEFLTFRGFRKGEKGILIAMPVFDERGAFAGPLVFIVEVGDLLKGFLPGPQPGRTAWVTDRDGTVLSHPRLAPGAKAAEAGWQGPAWDGFLAATLAGTEARGEYAGPDAAPVLAVSTPIRIADELWSVVVETDAREVRSGLALFNRELVAGTGFAILAILAGAALVCVESYRWNAALRAEVVERRRAERDLRLSEHSYRTLVENSPS